MKPPSSLGSTSVLLTVCALSMFLTATCAFGETIKARRLEVQDCSAEAGRVRNMRRLRRGTETELSRTRSQITRLISRLKMAETKMAALRQRMTRAEHSYISCASEMMGVGKRRQPPPDKPLNDGVYHEVFDDGVVIPWYHR
ncbi:Hypp7011 [Branchiostoma lanceolatum]|uniref:Hypp7011 protein n=1 Tax=Branchiostoma lanceolatum TaxID=7740 RepID=A0A8J9YWE5_BRALA|nr:Hypp7011 [Branchiostoma lanceolatum]